MKDYSVWYQVFNPDGTLNTEDILGYFDTFEKAVSYADDGDIIRYYEGCNGCWDWDVADKVDWKEWNANKKMKTFIINEKNPAGGKSYTEYTWAEVLEWFGAPENVADIEELEIWISERDGMDCQYEIEEWKEY